MKPTGMDVEFLPVDAVSQSFPCQALHAKTAAADFEVWLDPRQKIYLCMDHAEEMVRKTTTGNANAEVSLLRKAKPT